MTKMQITSAEAPLDCPLCPRLKDFREDNQKTYPDFFNAPVPGFGDRNAKFLIVGLAPGLKGANRTGRPFTGDYAGDLLYPTLLKFGFAEGTYRARPDDGMELRGAFITNAVRCVPPQNKPVGEEIKTCRPFLLNQIKAMKNLEIILALGGIAHKSVVATFGKRQVEYPFGHGNSKEISPGLTLMDSYHCSRYNTNTKRLTTEMFEGLFETIREKLY
ncbi:MAG: uracil-DNA glycosylase [Sphingomonadales bacterium]